MHSGTKPLFAVLLVAALQAFATPVHALEPPVPATIEFNRDVRPILSDNCFFCHGPDAKGHKAGLRLDRKENAFGELRNGGHALVAGKSADSELVRRIASTNKKEKMPPTIQAR